MYGTSGITSVFMILKMSPKMYSVDTLKAKYLKIHMFYNKF